MELSTLGINYTGCHAEPVEALSGGFPSLKPFDKLRVTTHKDTKVDNSKV